MEERACHTAGQTAVSNNWSPHNKATHRTHCAAEQHLKLTSRQQKAPGRRRAVIVPIIISVPPPVAVAAIKAAAPASPEGGSSKRESRMKTWSTGAAVKALRYLTNSAR